MSQPTPNFLGPTVHVDAGTDGRIMVADSLSYYENEPWFNDVTVGASFAGAPTAAMCMRQGSKAWIAHEGGPGKDDAGISGLILADRYSVPAVAIATMEARLSDGWSLLVGRVSAANEHATRLGVTVGQTGDEAARLMLKADVGKLRDFSGIIDESTHEVFSTDKGKVFAVWSFSRVKGKQPNDVFCVASHGAKVMAQYALTVRPRGLICNDAGRGLGNSGMEGIYLMDEAGIPAATVSAESARIGDALSTYEDGIVSGINRRAVECGVEIGQPARLAAERMLAEG